MDKITQKLDFVGIRTSFAISIYYGLFIILTYFLGKNYFPEISKNSSIFNLYIHLDNSLGGYIISFFWAFLDALTLMAVVMIFNKILKMYVK